MTPTRAIKPVERDQVADKTVIVTGASQGIGAGLANRFLERGYNVVATSRRVSQSAEIGASGRLACVDGDIAEPETAKAVVETALARFGSIDALVNNAGVFFTKPFIDYTIEDTTVASQRRISRGFCISRSGSCGRCWRRSAAAASSALQRRWWITPSPA
jgi:NAD(P)-dependent dehydrogenase (short-subunit alcohol dehydrogenase family)